MGRSSLAAYQGPYYGRMNRYLRGQESSAYTSKSVLNSITHLTDFLRPLVVIEDTMVYRGTSVGAFGPDGLDILSPGDIIREPGFMSTSFSRTKAEEFANFTDGVLLELQLPSGTTGVGVVDVIVENSWESEVLFTPGRKIYVTGKTTTKDYISVKGVILPDDDEG